MKENKERTFLTDTNFKQLKEVNAKESIALAKTGGNPDYVRLNEKLIADLK